MANPYPAVFRDDNSDTRLAGAIDFTDPANQPVSPPVVDRALYDTSDPKTTVTADTFTLLPWRYDDAGFGFQPLNITDLTQPIVKEAGIYAVAVTFNCHGLHAGKASEIGLFLDSATSGGYATGILPLDGLTQGDSSTIDPQLPMTVVWYCPAGAVFNAFTVPNVTSDWYIEGIVQRLSGAA